MIILIKQLALQSTIAREDSRPTGQCLECAVQRRVSLDQLCEAASYRVVDGESGATVNTLMDSTLAALYSFIARPSARNGVD